MARDRLPIVDERSTLSPPELAVALEEELLPDFWASCVLLVPADDAPVRFSLVIRICFTHFQLKNISAGFLQIFNSPL